ncbi:MAG TPA: DUF3289 family protein [Flavobacterium sp.]|nr:DUF3289 family protein [Flavobacterium sp.]
MAGGKITRIALKGSKTDVEGDFNGFYKRLSMTAGDNNAFKAKVTNHGEPKQEPKAGKYFVKGWWTNHKNEPIKRAIYGQKLHYHIEMDKAHAKPGDVVYFGLYDSDMYSFGNDVVKADDPIGLHHEGSGKPYTYENVNKEYKVIIKFSTTDNLEQWTSKLDQDKIFELYFRCSYVNRGATEHVELPYNFHDYLQLGAIVIDRFKMPGLNRQGTDIADDMAYGTGYPYKTPIYDRETLECFTKEYKTLGFDIKRHGEFANLYVEPITINLEEVVITGKATPKPTNFFEARPTQIPADHTRVVIPEQPSLEEMQEVKERLNKKNEKAIYSKNTIKNLGNLMRLTASSTNEDALWFDFKAMSRGLLSRGKLNENIALMISKMQRNEGGIFENQYLTDALLENPATLIYLQQVEDYIAEQLKTKFSKLEEVEDKEPYFETSKDTYANSKGDRKSNLIGKNFTGPAYTWKKDWNVLRGETIALNDIWATQVILKQVLFVGDNYTAKYEVTLWDHFGLDSPDMQKFYSYGAGFRAWFVLQHLWGYKPFLTKIFFIREFKGNLQKGMRELQSERAEQRRIEAEELNRQIQIDIWTSPKF